MITNNILKLFNFITNQEEENEKIGDYTSSEEEDFEEEDDSEDESDSSVDDQRPGKKPKKMFEAVDSEKFSMLKKDEDDEADNMYVVYSLNIEFDTYVSLVYLS